MIKHIFFDFNGTIIDDVKLCLDLLNEILVGQGHKPASIEEYKDIFKFPIKDYYIDAGVDFNKESFESLADKFIKSYQPQSFHCGLYPKTEETIKYIRNKKIHTYILSASEVNNLKEQCEVYGITNLFDDILGIDNIHATSKVKIALDYMEKHNINPDECLFVGDTDHDALVSDKMGCRCVLVSAGHQSVNVLKKTGKEIIPALSELISYLGL